MIAANAQAASAFQEKSNLVHLGRSNSASKAAAAWARAMVPWYHSRWVRVLEARLNELTSLPRGWNGYRSLPVSFSCASFAANLLERICVDGLAPPSLVPGTDGTLQIEWHRNKYDLEIDVLGPGNVIASRTDLVTGQCDEIELQNDFTQLAAWVRELATARGDIEAATA